MRIVVHERPPVDFSSGKRRKADYVVELADYALLLWIALDGYEPEPGARVTIEVARRSRKRPRMVKLCDSVVRALEMIGIDPAKFDRLEYKRLSDRRPLTRITFK